MLLDRHIVLVPEAGARVDVSKALGLIRTANESGGAVFSGRLKYTDANKGMAWFWITAKTGYICKYNFILN